MEKAKGYEGWGIVELFGHQTIAGRLSSETVGGCPMLRVDVPETEGAQAFTKFYGSGAIYAMTPTDEATAHMAAHSIQARPVELWIVPTQRSLPAAEDKNFL